jgi:hypothetical protein
MSLHHDLQTVIFPYLDVFTKIKFSHINWALYNTFFKLDIDDVNTILQEYGENKYIGYFFDKRFDFSGGYYVNQMKIYINRLIKINEDNERKTTINKLLDEYNVSVKFFQKKPPTYGNSWYNNITFYHIVTCVMGSSYIDLKFYKKLLLLIDDEQFAELLGMRHDICIYNNYWTKNMLQILATYDRITKDQLSVINDWYKKFPSHDRYKFLYK